jgi:hypothetical protein
VDCVENEWEVSTLKIRTLLIEIKINNAKYLDYNNLFFAIKEKCKVLN